MKNINVGQTVIDFTKIGDQVHEVSVDFIDSMRDKFRNDEISAEDFELQVVQGVAHRFYTNFSHEECAGIAAKVLIAGWLEGLAKKNPLLQAIEHLAKQVQQTKEPEEEDKDEEKSD